MTALIQPKRLVGLLEQLWHAGGGLPFDGLDTAAVSYAHDNSLVGVFQIAPGLPEFVMLSPVGRRVIWSKRRRFLRTLIDADREPSGGHGITVEMKTLRALLAHPGRVPTEQGEPTRQLRRLRERKQNRKPKAERRAER